MNIGAALTGPLDQETVDLVALVRRSVVQLHTARGYGSGVIWDTAGLIVTNDHVVSRDRAEIELADGRRFSGEVIARDVGNDLAALRVSARDLPAVCAGDSRELRVGELILAIGHPFGIAGTATLGIVSATGSRLWMGSSGRELLQADVELAPGSSGSPLANMVGEVVGVASMIVSPGIAVAIPSHIVQRFLKGSIQRWHVS